MTKLTESAIEDFAIKPMGSEVRVAGAGYARQEV